MDQLIAPALTLAVGFALGWSIAVLIARSRQQQLLLDAETRARTSLQEQKNLLDEARQRLSENFKSMAADAIRDSSENLLALASERFSRLQQEASADLGTRQKNIEELIRPVRETLEKFDSEVRQIEGARREAYGSLAGQLRSLSETQEVLRLETSNLVKALRNPAVRGRWGEMQLQRVVEISGMVEHCDFDTQHTLTGDNGMLRPDMIVRLPGDRRVVVDSKAPLTAYLEALEASDDQRKNACLLNHAQQIRTHMMKLSGKAYWDACGATPEFVVLFLPGEMFFSAALSQDPTLIEDAAARKVIIATPTTLIALLRSVSYGWRERNLAQNAEQISQNAQDLYERLVSMVTHLAKLGSSLGRSIESYNEAIGSFEGRVMPAARRFTDLGVSGKKEIEDLTPVDQRPRELLTLVSPEPKSRSAA